MICANTYDQLGTRMLGVRGTWMQFTGFSLRPLGWENINTNNKFWPESIFAQPGPNVGFQCWLFLPNSHRRQQKSFLCFVTIYGPCSIFFLLPESGKSRVSTNFKVILIVAAAVVVACIALVVSAPFKRRVSAQRRRRNQFLSDSSASHGPTVDRKICSEQAQCPVRSDTSYCRRDVEAWLEATQMNDLSTHRDVIDRSSQLTLMPWQHRLHLVVPPHYPGENAVAGTPSQACDYEILI